MIIIMYPTFFQYKLEAQPTLYRSPDNRMILKQISKGDNHYLKKQQPS